MSHRGASLQLACRRHAACQRPAHRPHWVLRRARPICQHWAVHQARHQGRHLQLQAFRQAPFLSADAALLHQRRLLGLGMPQVQHPGRLQHLGHLPERLPQLQMHHLQSFCLRQLQMHDHQVSSERMTVLMSKAAMMNAASAWLTWRRCTLAFLVVINASVKSAPTNFREVSAQSAGQRLSESRSSLNPQSVGVPMKNLMPADRFLYDQSDGKMLVLMSLWRCVLLPTQDLHPQMRRKAFLLRRRQLF